VRCPHDWLTILERDIEQSAALLQEEQPTRRFLAVPDFFGFLSIASASQSRPDALLCRTCSMAKQLSAQPRPAGQPREMFASSRLITNRTNENATRYRSNDRAGKPARVWWTTERLPRRRAREVRFLSTSSRGFSRRFATAHHALCALPSFKVKRRSSACLCRWLRVD